MSLSTSLAIQYMMKNKLCVHIYLYIMIHIGVRTGAANAAFAVPDNLSWI